MERKLITYAMSDTDVVKTIGAQMKQMRINSQLTQQQLSSRAGVMRSTVARIENGESVSLQTVVSLLRGMNQLEVLNAFYAPAVVSPITIAKQQGRPVKRVRTSSVFKAVPQYKSEW